jgi:hypothetical protein
MRAEKPTEPDPQQSPDLPLEVARQALERQLGSLDSLDAKISNVFTWGGALLGILAAVMALRPERFHGKALICFYVAVAAYAGIAAFSMWAILPRTWPSGPPADQIVADYRKGTSEAVAKWKALRAYLGSTKANADRIELKARLFQACWVLLVLQTAAAVFGFVFVAD